MGRRGGRDWAPLTGPVSSLLPAAGPSTQTLPEWSSSCSRPWRRGSGCCRPGCPEIRRAGWHAPAPLCCVPQPSARSPGASSSCAPGCGSSVRPSVWRAGPGPLALLTSLGARLGRKCGVGEAAREGGAGTAAATAAHSASASSSGAGGRRRAMSGPWGLTPWRWGDVPGGCSLP